MKIFSFNDKPDFAFPATVAEKANVIIEEVESGKQPLAPQDFAALIQYYVAKNLIDEETVPSIIERYESLLTDSTQPADSAVLNLLIARIYLNYYNSEPWIFDRRKLPLSEPFPEDISEWSGDMFKICIANLCRQAEITLRNNLDAFRDSISEYKEFITIPSELTTLCYPTLADFVESTIASIYSQIGKRDLAEAVCTFARDSSPEGSYPWYTWEMQRLQLICSSTNDSMLSLYRSNPNAPGAILPLLEFTSSIVSDLPTDYIDPEESEYAEAERLNRIVPYLINALEVALTTDSADAVATNITSYIAALRSPAAYVQYPDMTPSTAPLKVDVMALNCAEVQIDLFHIPDDVAQSYSALNKYRLGKPIKTVTLTVLGDSLCRYASTEIDLPEPGYFYIRPHIETKEHVKNDYKELVRSLPIVPVAMSNVSSPFVAVVDASTGTPIKDARVIAIYDVKTTTPVSTDSRGVANVVPEWDWSRVQVIYDHRKYLFPDVSVNKSTNRSFDLKYSASILTDRPLYRPGQTVNFVAVVCSLEGTTGSSPQRSEIATNFPIKIYLTTPNNEVVTTLTGKTDDFGRLSGSFLIPDDGSLAGRYRIEVYQTPDEVPAETDADDRSYQRRIDSASIIVSDFRMPEFEFADINSARGVPEEGSVTVTGRLLTYSGMPVASAEVNVDLRAMNFGWWFTPAETLRTFSVTTDVEGCFTAVFTPDMLNADKFYQADFRAVAASGATVSASTAFSTGKPYSISATIPANADVCKPVEIKTEIVSPDNKSVDITLQWTLLDKKGGEVAKGRVDGPLDLSKIAPGQYSMRISSVDPTLVDPYTSSIILYDTRGTDVPFDIPVWSPESRINVPYADNGVVDANVLVVVSGESTVYATINVGCDILSIRPYSFTQGYHHIPVYLPAGAESASIEIFAVRSCKVYRQSIHLVRESRQPIEITCSSFRDKLTPGAEETWNFRITSPDGSPVEAAMVIDLYNKALEALAPHSLPLQFPSISVGNRMNLNFTYLRYQNTSDRAEYSYQLFRIYFAPEFNFYGYTTGRRRFYDSGSVMLDLRASKASYDNDEVHYNCAPTMAKAEAVFEDEMDEEVAVVGETSSEADAPGVDIDVREAEVPLAAWAPMLTSNPDGSLSFSFTVPNAVTTWRLRSVAWTHDCQVATLMRDFLANKPLMVQTNFPRFLRQGDSVKLVATIFNNTDSAVTATYTFEAFNPFSPKDSAVLYTSSVEIVGTQAVVSFQLSTIISDPALEHLLSLPAVGVRVRVSSDSFTDGEQTAIPLLTSMSQLVETEPFYLNPGEAEYSTKLPKGQDSRISLTFSANPVWTIVSALPGLRGQFDYANSASASLFSACISRGLLNANPEMKTALRAWVENPSDSILVSALQKNEDLKIALLNATPWVRDALSETERMAALATIFDDAAVDKEITSAIDALVKLQRSDGGWPWGSWSKESSFWVTLNVLEGFADLYRFGWLPDDKDLHKTIDRALAYLDKTVDSSDMTYAVVRQILAPIRSISTDGRQVITKTLEDIRKNWKGYRSDLKALAAEALWQNNDPNLARTLMASIAQFGVATPSKGIKFPSVSWLGAYGLILDAFAMIDPQSPCIDGIRQHLIVNKQANDWGIAASTMQVITGILSCGSHWTIPTCDTQIAVKTASHPAAIVDITPTRNEAWLPIRLDLSDYPGGQLNISRTPSGPAYGAVYAQFRQKMSEVKSSACDDLDITKTMLVRRGTGWERVKSDALTVGDRVKVLLTIHCKRQLQYVSLIDERPAAFEPAEQLPGWIFSEGTAFYRENRDSDTRLSIEWLSPGTYQLEYEMNVVYTGQFSSGVASIQSQYAPEISAHSAGTIITVE